MLTEPAAPRPTEILEDLRWIQARASLLPSNRKQFTLPQEKPTLEKVSMWTWEEFFASPASYRVGYYVEELVRFLLSHDSTWEKIENSRQIFSGKQTLGELDFVLTSANGCLTHIELACKFYLHTSANHPSASQLLGPKAADWLEKKTTRLLNHQLTLGQKCLPEGTHSLPCLLGAIFSPLGLDTDPVSPSSQPSFLQDAAPSSYRWARIGDLAAWDSKVDDKPLTHGSILKKPFWLASRPNSTPAPILLSELEKHFAVSSFPQLTSWSTNSGHNESLRLFVVDNLWPSDC